MSATYLWERGVLTGGFFFGGCVLWSDHPLSAGAVTIMAAVRSDSCVVSFFGGAVTG